MKIPDKCVGLGKALLIALTVLLTFWLLQAELAYHDRLGLEVISH